MRGYQGRCFLASFILVVIQIIKSKLFILPFYLTHLNGFAFISAQKCVTSTLTQQHMQSLPYFMARAEL